MYFKIFQRSIYINIEFTVLKNVYTRKYIITSKILRDNYTRFNSSNQHVCKR